jgi:hypothetical protein
MGAGEEPIAYGSSAPAVGWEAAPSPVAAAPVAAAVTESSGLKFFSKRSKPSIMWLLSGLRSDSSASVRKRA